MTDRADRAGDDVAGGGLSGLAALVDEIVQGIVAARWAIDAGNHDRAATILDRSLALAQGLATELLGNEPVQPGDLVRGEPSGRPDSAGDG